MERYSNKKEILEVTSPTDDFFRHVNGEWLENTELPPGEPRFGTYDMIRDNTSQQLLKIVEDLQTAGDFEKGSVEQQTCDFYRSGIDMETRDRLGLEPLNELRAAIGGIADSSDVMSVAALMQRKGMPHFFDIDFVEDDKKAGSNAMYLSQGGLALPNRNYYLKDDEASQKIRDDYKKFKMILFQMMGRTLEESEHAADAVYAIEYALAEASLTAAEARPIEKNYFKFTLDEATAATPGVDWDTYFSELGKPGIKDFVIQQPGFMKAVGEVLQNANINDIKDYLEFRLVNSCAYSLSQEVADVNFAFKGQVLSGLREPQPLWKQIISRFNQSSLCNAIGPLYEQKQPRDKAKLEQMQADVKDAFRDAVLQIDWMSPETKELTLQKLEKIVYKMGYPDQWPDVSAIDIRPDTLLQNHMNMAEYSTEKHLAQLDEPFDLNEWYAAPTVVNAFSDLKREMLFPAAVLQTPFFDATQDDAYNYGAIGATMGHETTHFFDDEGCQYDLEGNLNNWWSEQDEENFKARTRPFADYFGSLKANGLQVDGELTLGENIADVGGIKIAYYAYQKKLERDGVREIIDGLTPEQRFFVGWARKWMTKVTPEYAQRAILTDPHAPAEIRVNGVMAITPEFHEAFNVQEGDKMYVAPADRPVLW